MGTKLVPIGPQRLGLFGRRLGLFGRRLGLFGRLYRALRNTKYGRLLLELMTRTLGCLILAGLQHPGPLRGPPTAGPTLAMTNLPCGSSLSSVATDYSTTILQQVMSLSVAESVGKLEDSLKWNLGGLR